MASRSTPRAERREQRQRWALPLHFRRKWGGWPAGPGGVSSSPPRGRSGGGPLLPLPCALVASSHRAPCRLRSVPRVASPKGAERSEGESVGLRRFPGSFGGAGVGLLLFVETRLVFLSLCGLTQCKKRFFQRLIYSTFWLGK